jgi:hypothetical protein
MMGMVRNVYMTIGWCADKAIRARKDREQPNGFKLKR